MVAPLDCISARGPGMVGSCVLVRVQQIPGRSGKAPVKMEGILFGMAPFYRFGRSSVFGYPVYVDQQ